MAELNFGLLTPPGSQSIGNAFVSGMDQAAAARQMENQNALSQYTLSKARREDEVNNRLLNDLRAAKTPQEQRQAYINAGRAKDAAEMESALLKNQETQGKINLQPGAMAKQQSELLDAELARSREALNGVSTPEGYLAWHQANHNNKIIGPALAERGITEQQARDRIDKALKTPGGLEQLINESKLGVEKFATLNRPNVTTQNTGTTTGLLSVPGLGGSATPVPGSSAAIQPGPGTAASNIQASIAMARARDEGIPVSGTPMVNSMPGAAPAEVPANAMLRPLVAPGVQQTTAPTTTVSTTSGLSPAAARRVAEATAKAQIPHYDATAGGFVTPPTTSNPKGTFVPLTAVQDAKDVEANRKTLKLAGYDHTTGKDEISDLIRQSTSGGLQAGGAATQGFFGSATTGAEAIGRLETRAKAMTLSLLNGKLGAGISNADRDFIEGQLGSISNPNIAAGKRLAAWDEVKKRMLSLGMLDSPDQPKSTSGGATGQWGKAVVK